MSLSGVSYVPSGVDWQLNNLENAEPLYAGKVNADGDWLIQKLVGSATMTYAMRSNNPGTASYQTAWDNRLTLTYGQFQTL